MDLLYWRNANNNTKIRTTKKAYFNRHLWRLEYNIPRADIITRPDVRFITHWVDSKKAAYEQLFDNNKNRLHADELRHYYGPGGYTSVEYDRIMKVDAKLLTELRELRGNMPEGARMRVEHDTLQIYADTEELLKDIAEKIHTNEILSVTGPKEGTEQKLLEGAVLMSDSYSSFKYKIMLRDGTYPIHIKETLLRQLMVADGINLPHHTLKSLKKKYTYLWGCYFYAEDDSLVTILSLVAPGIIGKVHPIEVLSVL
jgi:hypothetical protein